MGEEENFNEERHLGRLELGPRIGWNYKAEKKGLVEKCKKMKDAPSVFDYKHGTSLSLLSFKINVGISSQSCPKTINNIMLRREEEHYPEVIWVHAVFTPSRMETAVEIRSPKVDLVFIHLRCNLLSPRLRYIKKLGNVRVPTVHELGKHFNSYNHSFIHSCVLPWE